MWSSVWHRAGRGSVRAFSRSARRMDKAMEKLEVNPYYEKYASRIAELQKTDPEEFKKRAQAVVPPPRKPAATPAEPEDAMGRYAAVLRPKEAVGASDGRGDGGRRLEDIMKLELVADKTAEEVCALWEQYHRTQDVVAAVVTPQAYDCTMERARDNPTFVVPLPREHGYEFFLLQVAGRSVHFTPLLAYQVHRENAPECLTMTHYTELRNTKGVLLMRADYDKHVLSPTEARCLVNQFQLYYSSNDEERLQLLETFTKTPDSFRHMDLIKHVENISLTT